MSLIGKEVQPFTAQAYKNGEFIEVTDENLKGQWSVVCFYPADFSFVCPTELEDLQNQYAALKELGTEVYSVSTDTHFVHKGWHDASEKINKITYAMIGDLLNKSLVTSRFLMKLPVLQIVERSSLTQMALFKP